VSKDLRNAFGRFATGVTIVTTSNPDGTPIGMTVNSFTSLSLDPPMLLWCIGKSAGLFDLYMNSSNFCVHVLADGQQDLAMTFATRDVDRFADVKYQRDSNQLPLLGGCLGRFSCTTQNKVDAGDHVILVGAIDDYEIGDGDPLIFYGGKFLSQSAAETAG